MKLTPSYFPLACSQNEVDLVFVLDGSGSICENDPTYANGVCDNWNLMLTFLTDFVDRLTVASDRFRIGFVLFSTESQVVFQLDT